ncbi:MAG: tRNA uracil 4-sulfurtransferase ThiI [Candidatus Woesearchaeota archaeon]|jgi:thiamine biosynthesis protein ThiI|nr:tRNA uracil 4-sulfurtransferase ThiI [Candidatus Woesearchaeota archaeon]MDP7457122.1 tRNA uracil 4-sulfurtransferase ThiI [Candidatus Woesearchaeota archaeon]
MKPNCIIIHYAEIALKGKNRSYFEKLLIKNCEKKLGSLATNIFQDMSHIVVETKETEKASDILKKIPGIAYFSPAVKCKLDLEELKKQSIAMLKNKKFSTFKISAKRRKKESPFDSMELNNKLGQEVVDKLKKKAKMESPDMDLKVEIANHFAYLSLEDIKGVGGFPTDPRQKVVTLLSGGFDSPVAAYMMMKRGCEVLLVHFQNKNTLTKSVQDKIERLATQLSKFQIKTKLFIVHFEDIQKEIIKKVKAEQRMLIYRKVMLKIAAEIANQHKARFLVTGDSISQVASQTLDNLQAVYAESPLQVLTPLIGFDKQEIINLADKIGTGEISKEPYGDCCSYFVPQHPELRAKSADLKAAEENLSYDIRSTIKNSAVFEYK